MGWASIYMAARSVDLSAHEKLVMRIVKDQQPIRRDRLLDLSPLGHEDTVTAMKSLYGSARLYLDGTLSFMGTRRIRMKPEAAWLRAIREQFDLYGLITAEALSGLLGHEIPMRVLRKLLRQLEDEELVVKGYLLKGSGTLYWCTRKAYAELGKMEFTEGFILSPEDNLTQYLRAAFRDLMPETGRYAVLRGAKVIGSFGGKMHGGKPP